MPNYGIDSQVQQRVDAYRGQPDKLMQSYQNNQQLIDLLALQKLKTEKEATARQMQLEMARKMGGPQPTVAEQRESEVLDLTKQELAKQVAGTGQQQAQDAQARMQEVLQGGIASQAAPNIAGMAGGGIVAFADGGDISEDWNDPQLAGTRGSSSPLAKLIAAWKRANERAKRYQETGSADEPLPPETVVPAVAAPDTGPSDRLEAALREEPVATAPTSAGIASIPVPTPALPTARTSQEMFDEGLKNRETAGIAATTAGRELFADDPALMARQAENRAKLQAEYDRMNDPKRQKWDRISAWLRGAGGRSGIGSVMAGASAGMANTRAEQEAARVNQLKELGEMDTADIARGDTRNAQVADFVSKNVNDTTAMVNSALQASATEMSAVTNAAQQQANREADIRLGEAQMAVQKEVANIQAGARADSVVPAMQNFYKALADRIAIEQENARLLPTDEAKISAQERINAMTEQLDTVQQTLQTLLGVSGQQSSTASGPFSPGNMTATPVQP